MNCLKSHYNQILIKDFFLKDISIKINKIPGLQKISLTAKFSGNYKASSINLFELLTFSKPTISTSHTNNLSLNLRKGEPVGVKITLRKKTIYNFLETLIFEILPSSKKSNNLKVYKNCIHIQLKDILSYEETSNAYIYLQNLSTLDIVLCGNNVNGNFFQAFRLPKIKNNFK